jgi:predicted kinase
MKLAETEIPETEKSAARAKARARWLFALAELEEPGRRPCLVLLGGLPGSGKSTLAHALAERAGFSVIRSDVVRKALVAASREHGSQSAPAGDYYTDEWNDRTYRECLHRAEAILFEGGRVLIDASFQNESWRRLFLDAGRRWGIANCLIVCEANADVVRQRLNQRRGDASDADWAVYTEIARRWEDLTPRTQAMTRRVDTSGTKEAAERSALDILREVGLFVSSETSS